MLNEFDNLIWAHYWSPFHPIMVLVIIALPVTIPRNGILFWYSTKSHSISEHNITLQNLSHHAHQCKVALHHLRTIMNYNTKIL